MGLKTNMLEKELRQSVEERDFIGSMEILSKDKKLAEKYLDAFVNLDVFPEIAKEYVESMGKLIESNNKSSDNLFQLFRETRLGLQNYLDNNVKELSPEERRYVGEQIIELNKMAVKLDRDNKALIMKIAGSIGGVLAFIGFAIVSGMANKNESIESADDNDDYIDAEYEES